MSRGSDDGSQSSTSESGITQGQNRPSAAQQQTQQSVADRTTNFFQRRAESATQSVLAISIIGALISGYFVQWTITNLLVSLVLFVIFSLASWTAIIGRSLVLGAISTFFYTVSVAGLIAPVLFFVQLTTEINSASGLEALGSGIGLAAVFPTVSLLHLHVAIASAVIGYALSRTTGKNEMAETQIGGIRDE